MKWKNPEAEMKKKESVDYIFFASSIKEAETGKENKKDKVEVSEKNLAGIKMLQIEVKEKATRKKKGTSSALNEKLIKKIKRKLRHYDLKDSIVGADEEMAEKLQLKETLFQARKQELLKNKERIIRQGRMGKKEQGRNSMLLVLDSREWNHREIFSIFSTAKDYYEDIYILCKESCVEIEQLVRELLEEWGVVLHVLKEGEPLIEQADFALLLLKNWDLHQWDMISFGMAYAVMDVETGGGIKRGREKFIEKEGIVNKGGRIYSGLVYEKQGKQLPYQLGVNISWQNPFLYEEFDISIIAIYRLKW